VRARGRLGTQAYTYARTRAHPHARWRPIPDPRPSGRSFEPTCLATQTSAVTGVVLLLLFRRLTAASSGGTVHTHRPVGERASRGYRARSRDPDIPVSV